MRTPVPALAGQPQPPTALIADWRDFAFLHFAVEAAELAPHVPYPLDLFDGRAWVSLVAFRLENMRPAARWLPATMGRWLMRPVSDHAFLNVRTYVRGAAGPGIHFINEWIDGRVSRLLGPPAYGLPYRLAAIERRELPGSGLQRLAVHGRIAQHATQIVFPTSADGPARETAPGSLEAFLFERYVAYTHRKGVGRWFAVEHPRWQVAPFQLARFDPGFFADVYPWFNRATFVGGHLTDGFTDVAMSAPRRIATATLPVANGPVPAGVPVPVGSQAAAGGN